MKGYQANAEYTAPDFQVIRIESVKIFCGSDKGLTEQFIFEDYE